MANEIRILRKGNEWSLFDDISKSGVSTPDEPFDDENVIAVLYASEIEGCIETSVRAADGSVFNGRLVCADMPTVNFSDGVTDENHVAYDTWTHLQHWLVDDEGNPVTIDLGTDHDALGETLLSQVYVFNLQSMITTILS